MRVQVLFIFLVLLAMALPSSAQSIISQEVGAGYVKTCYDNGKCTQRTATTYPLSNGSYSLTHIGNISYNASQNSMDLKFDGGWIQVRPWTGGLPIDYILDNQGGQVSMYSGWYSENWRTQGQGSWVVQTPLSHILEVDYQNLTLKRKMGLLDGGWLNVTYIIRDGQLKFDVNRTAGNLGRKERVTYGIDIINGKGKILNTSKQFNPELSDKIFMLWDYSDVYPASFNNTTGQWLDGHNSTSFIDQGGSRYNFQVELNGSTIMGQGVKDSFDPSWTTSGSVSWTNTSYINSSVFAANQTIFLYSPRTTTTSRGYNFNENTGTVAYDINATPINLISLTASSWITNAVSGSGYDTSTTNARNTTLSSLMPNSGTIIGWFRPTAEINSSTLQIIMYDQNYIECGWVASDTRFYCQVYDTAFRPTYSPSGVVFSAGSQYWFKYRYRANLLQLEIGNTTGYYSTTTTTTYSGTLGTAALQSIGIGGRRGTNTLRFNGQVDEFYHLNTIESGGVFNPDGYTQHWYNSGTGNETYQIDTNVTTLANTNYSVFYRANGTGSWTVIGTANATANQSISLSTKYQNTDVKVELYGNTTATPELLSITFWTQTAGAADTTFTVSLPAGYTYLQYAPSNSTATNFYPSGQNSTQPFFNVSNQGSSAQSFRFYLNSTVSGISDYADLNSDHTSGKIAVNVSTSTVIVSSLATGSSQNVWMLIDLNRPVPQNTNKSLTINSS
jgi:hypothetical protein